MLMKLPGELNSEQTRQLEIVRNNARHLLALINDLLNLAKIESGKLEATLESTDCSVLVNEIAASLRPQALSKGLEFTVTVPAEPLVFETDRRALSQILINLAGNAIKFTERGSVRVVLSDMPASERRRLVLSVTDTGPGIAEDELPTLFEAFVQGQASRARGVEGTGLGLHLSRKLAELLGGELTCTSSLGVGSVFTLSLPEM
jgi:signal transduction histidine kinase